MKINKLILLFITFFVLNNSVAAECTDSEIKALKEKASDLTITYELGEEYNAIDHEINDTYTRYDNYNVTISNFTSDFYITIDDYSYKNTSDITDENHNFTYNTPGGITFYHIYSSTCDILLKEVKLYLPINNYYSHKEECKGVNTIFFKECQEWVKEEDYDYFSNLTYEEYERKMEDYKNSNLIDKTLIIFKNNKKTISIIFGTFLLVMIIVTIVIIKRKRGRLE